MAIIRLGTCGTPDSNVRIGSMVVPSSGSVLVRREPDAWSTTSSTDNEYYSISKPVKPTESLSQLVKIKIKILLN
jgi:uridine phosphorylase